ncbi:hypothetical protein HPB47_000648 [Ixodes persulcatus]|uniref:Uncharacterized protein n=1 Tax=Ixodes persulcatus TaxID=34615 RepID=A0AC60PRG8_IXOPE|nr:hypothetical protein HPB47_000648 [Ixodes persulcatus]
MPDSSFQVDSQQSLTANDLLKKIRRSCFVLEAFPVSLTYLKFQDYSEADLKPHVPADTTEEFDVMLYTSGTTGLPKGDLGYYDSNGQMYFVDRIKQMIKCMGNIVTPAELEEILTTHEAVLEAAVVGIPSSKYGEAPVAYVVVKESQEKSLDSLEQELKELVADGGLNPLGFGGVFGQLDKLVLHRGIGAEE